MDCKLTINNTSIEFSTIILDDDKLAFRIVYPSNKDFFLKGNTLQIRIEFKLEVPRSKRLYSFFTDEPTETGARISFSYPAEKTVEYIDFLGCKPNSSDETNTKILLTKSIMLPGNGIVFSIVDKQSSSSQSSYDCPNKAPKNFEVDVEVKTEEKTEESEGSPIC
jgi:hypothetical protein